MCMFGSAPSAPETPAPAPPPAAAPTPLDLKLNKDDKTQSSINKRNRKGKRKFRVDMKGPKQANMDMGGLGIGAQKSALGTLKK